MKYDYSNVYAQLKMLAPSRPNLNITDLKTFYPKAGYTELRAILQALVSEGKITVDEKQGYTITLKGNE